MEVRYLLIDRGTDEGISGIIVSIDTSPTDGDNGNDEGIK